MQNVHPVESNESLHQNGDDLLESELHKKIIDAEGYLAVVRLLIVVANIAILLLFFDQDNYNFWIVWPTIIVAAIYGTYYPSIQTIPEVRDYANQLFHNLFGRCANNGVALLYGRC